MRANAETAEHYTMLLYDEPMAKHTTWRVGGPARHYFQPADLADLSDFLRSLPVSEPILWLGLGSNLLVRDGGFKGTVIAMQGRLDEIEVVPGDRLKVGAGASCALVARQALGTGDQRPDHRPHGRGAPSEWFVGCELQLEPGDAERERAEIQRLLKQRNASQPVGEASAGSTFRNPPGGYAARLIEAAGLKGYRIGDAQVSEKHANFIINRGQATATEIERLIHHVQREVQKHSGVLLETEVHIVGEPA